MGNGYCRFGFEWVSILQIWIRVELKSSTVASHTPTNDAFPIHTYDSVNGIKHRSAL